MEATFTPEGLLHMSRMTTLMLLGAALMAGLAWWFEGRLAESGPGEDVAPVLEEPDQVAAVTGTPLVSETGSGAADALQRSPLTETTVEGRLASYHGPTLEVPVRLTLRTTEYFRSPPAADLGLELRYEERRGNRNYAGIEEAEVVARIRSDAQGIATCLLHLPATEDGKPVAGILYLRPTSQGFQDVVERIGIGNSTRVPMERELMFPLGATVSVRAVGLADRGRDWRRKFTLSVWKLGKEDQPLTAYFNTVGYGEDAHTTATFPLQEKGRYRLFAQCPEGVGVVQSIHLDPESPPEEITILIGEYGSISGKVMQRHAVLEEGLKVRAVAGDPSLRDHPPDSIPVPAWNFPPRLVDSPVNLSDGSFHLTGLAPGSYHLAYISAYSNDDLGRWFAHPPVPTGSHDLELELEETLLVLDLQRDLDNDGNSRKTATPKVKLEKLANREHAYTYEIRSSKGEGQPRGYPLLPGNRYRLLVWSPFHPIVEKEFDAPGQGGIWHMPVALPTLAPGTLTWSGPTEEITYEVLSPAFGARLEQWRTGWRDIPEQKFELPPGRYLVRAKGASDRESQHGNLGTTRTPFGVEEKWVDVRSGETAHLEFDPPKMGWLEIDLDAVGQPDPDLRSVDTFPALVDVQFESLHFPQDQASFVMRDLTRGGARALTFLNWGMSTFQQEVTYLAPGSVERPVEVFPPGKHELEVRVPGFPLQRHQVLIKEGAWTKVKVILQGME